MPTTFQADIRRTDAYYNSLRNCVDKEGVTPGTKIKQKKKKPRNHKRGSGLSEDISDRSKLHLNKSGERRILGGKFVKTFKKDSSFHYLAFSLTISIGDIPNDVDVSGVNLMAVNDKKFFFNIRIRREANLEKNGIGHFINAAVRHLIIQNGSPYGHLPCSSMTEP